MGHLLMKNCKFQASILKSAPLIYLSIYSFFNPTSIFPYSGFTPRRQHCGFMARDKAVISSVSLFTIARGPYVNVNEKCI